MLRIGLSGILDAASLNTGYPVYKDYTGGSQLLVIG